MHDVLVDSKASLEIHLDLIMVPLKDKTQQQITQYKNILKITLIRKEAKQIVPKKSN